jgi:hypothetical protein
LRIEVFAVPEVAVHVHITDFDADYFLYDKQNNFFTLPAKQILTTN